MNLRFVLFFQLLAALTPTADAACYGSTNYATGVSQTLSRRYYSNNEYCTFYIRPSSYYVASAFYLEIKWTIFNIEGNIPDCKDYVEVFLTSSYQSIGRYCSDNMDASKPFNMYSHDGYAKIVFKSDGSTTRSGFSLTHRLKSKLLSPMGGHATKSCYYNHESSTANFYSSGWPYRYFPYASPCWLRYHAGSNAMRIAVMDISLFLSYFEVKESSVRYVTSTDIRLHAETVSGRISMKSPTFYKTQKPYVYLFIHRPVMHSRYRGVMVGFMAYSEKKTETSVGVYVGIAVGCIAFVALLIIGVCCGRKLIIRRRNAQHGPQQQQQQQPMAVQYATSGPPVYNVGGLQTLSQPAIIFNQGSGAETWSTQPYATSQAPAVSPGSLPPKENPYLPSSLFAYPPNPQ